MISSKDVKKECGMHSNSDNIVVAPYTKANEVIDELFESLFSK